MINDLKKGIGDVGIGGSAESWPQALGMAAGDAA